MGCGTVARSMRRKSSHGKVPWGPRYSTSDLRVLGDPKLVEEVLGSSRGCASSEEWNSRVVGSGRGQNTKPSKRWRMSSVYHGQIGDVSKYIRKVLGSPTCGAVTQVSNYVSTICHVPSLPPSPLVCLLTRVSTYTRQDLLARNVFYGLC